MQKVHIAVTAVVVSAKTASESPGIRLSTPVGMLRTGETI